MRSKLLIFSLLATVSVVVFVAVTAVTVFAFVVSDSVQAEEAFTNETFEVAPIEVEPVSQTEVVNPLLSTEHASYQGGGCPYSHAAKAQLTEAPAEPVVSEDLLTLAD